jgi:uncharacterized membrane protein YqjE
MKFREQIGEPGLVTTLLSTVATLSVLILGLIFIPVIIAHVFYHRGHRWQEIVFLYVLFLAVLGQHLWKRRKARNVC